MAQRAGQRAAEIADAEPLDPIVAAQLEPDDRVFRIGVFRKAAERLVIRQQHDAGFKRGDFHGSSVSQRDDLSLYPSVVTPAKAGSRASAKIWASDSSFRGNDVPNFAPLRFVPIERCLVEFE